MSNVEISKGEPRTENGQHSTFVLRHSFVIDFRNSTSSAMPQISAGLLLFRRREGRLEVFLAHPGGPFWKKHDEGAWTIPKGLTELEEDLLAAACREFREETGIEPKPPYYELGSIRQKAGKTIHAWAFEGNADPTTVVSNMVQVEQPRGSGRWLTFPEIDRCEWYDLATARTKLNPAQAELLDRLGKLDLG
jgi:predicted NUDIX family NTP pyrophosphohydrolase